MGPCSSARACIRTQTVLNRHICKGVDEICFDQLGVRIPVHPPDVLLPTFEGQEVYPSKARCSCIQFALACVSAPGATQPHWQAEAITVPTWCAC